jgi:hypothetical protein
MTLLSAILSASSAVAGSANGLATTDASDLVVQGLSLTAKQACGLADSGDLIPLVSLPVLHNQDLLGLEGSSSGETLLVAQAAAGGTITIPAATDTLVGRQTTDTLANKTLASPAISGSTSGATVIQAAAAASGTLTLPSATDTLVGRTTTDTLTNKTLTAPVISGGTIDNAAIGSTTPLTGAFTSLSALALIKAPVYTVSALPTGSPGAIVFASNGRMFNGAGTLEGAGAGTGGLVSYNGTAWKIIGTNQTVQA